MGTEREGYGDGAGGVSGVGADEGTHDGNGDGSGSVARRGMGTGVETL